jgi:hypothetical protein
LVFFARISSLGFPGNVLQISFSFDITLQHVTESSHGNEHQGGGHKMSEKVRQA